MEIQKHTIFYGGENSFKYKHALNIIKKKSKSSLKYKRKVEIHLNDKYYYFNISDVHIEVDFDLLGTNEYAIWVALFQQIQHISKETMGNCIVLCMNFHNIKEELLDIFYTFLRDDRISFYICTRYISFIPDIIKKRCNVVCIPQKKKSIYNVKLCDPIIELIINNNTDYLLIRELLYNLLTYNLNIYQCVYYIISELNNVGYLSCEQFDSSLGDILDIMTKYNNNYRTIYHLERFVIYLIVLNTSTI